MTHDRDQPAKELAFVELERLVRELREADRDGISVQKMVMTLIHGFGFLPICEGDLKAGTLIIRARLNSNNALFTSEKDISYHPNASQCRHYGRASTPLRTVFYGCFVGGEVQHRVETIVAELGEIFRSQSDGSYDIPEEFFLTVGTWRVKREFKVAEMVYSKHFIEAHLSIRTAYEHYMENFRGKLGPAGLRAVSAIMEFICDEFSKPHIARHEDYLVSAAYSQALIETGPRSVEGIVYPSVRSNGRGINVALYPYTVETGLELIDATYCRVSETNNEPQFDILKSCNDFGPMNSRFVWFDDPSAVSR